MRSTNRYAFAASIWSSVSASRSVSAAVQAATQVLEKCAIPEPAASAEHLATACFDGIGSRWEARRDRRRPAAKQLEDFVKLCRKREEERVPIQYLVGEWDFHNVTLLVRAPVLIPRPETEELVEHLLGSVGSEEANILDVGCGSGAILCAALKARMGWRGVGVDIASEAIELSLENVKRLGLEDRCRLIAGDVYEMGEGRRFDALVSNPPYISSGDIEGLEREVKDHEDMRALCGGRDGLDVVRDILKVGPKVVKSGGSVWLELDSWQPQVLEGMKIDGMKFVEKVNDAFGNSRFCHMRVD